MNTNKDDLLNEAIADAHKVREMAYENAKAAIEETFRPKIQRMISTKLAEEEMDLDDETEDSMGEMEPSMEMEPEMFSDEDEMEFMPEEAYIDDGQDGTPASNLKEEELDEEFEKIIRELEGGTEELQEKDDVYDEKFGSSRKNIGETEMSSYNADDTGEEDDLENLNLESLIKILEEEEFGTTDSSEDEPEMSDIQAENARLREENARAFKALSEMKSTMNEVNLLNSKLMYSSKIIQSFDLTESQQVKVLETFDRAASVREVKLIFTTIKEHYSSRSKRYVKKSVSSKMNESSSRTIRSVKKSANDTGLMEGAYRFQQIAGLKPLND